MSNEFAPIEPVEASTRGNAVQGNPGEESALGLPDLSTGLSAIAPAPILDEPVPEFGPASSEGPLSFSETARDIPFADSAVSLAPASDALIDTAAPAIAALQETSLQALSQFATSAGSESALNAVFEQAAGQPSASSVISEILSGDRLPDIQAVPIRQLGARGAYAADTDTIFIAENLLGQPEQASRVFLEELGHYIDDQGNPGDSAGDEGALFAAQVMGDRLSSADISAIKAEDDNAVITIGNQQLQVEQNGLEPGTFAVGESGEISMEFIVDNGGYESQIGVFSLEGMEALEPGSVEFIREAARRVLSNTEGYLTIDDQTEGAALSGNLGEKSQNAGTPVGSRTFAFEPGTTIAVMMVPDGSIQEILENPAAGGRRRPLFSMDSANPEARAHMGQIRDGLFAVEDIRFDSARADGDYNDIVFSLEGATSSLRSVTELLSEEQTWPASPLGRQLFAVPAGPSPEPTSPEAESPADPIAPTSPVDDAPPVDDVPSLPPEEPASPEDEPAEPVDPVSEAPSTPTEPSTDEPPATPEPTTPPVEDTVDPVEEPDTPPVEDTVDPVEETPTSPEAETPPEPVEDPIAPVPEEPVGSPIVPPAEQPDEPEEPVGETPVEPEVPAEPVDEAPTEPEEPAEPTEPVDEAPTEPEEPVEEEPAEPETPAEPENPEEPIDELEEPTEPEAPEEPVDEAPTEPGEPVEEEPTEPEAPEEPVDETPAEPEEPVEEEPAEPETPAEPENPVEPIDEPEEPTEPEAPEEPVDETPTEPEEPVDEEPTEPEAPEEPVDETPTEPEEPAEPELPEEPVDEEPSTPEIPQDIDVAIAGGTPKFSQNSSEAEIAASGAARVQIGTQTIYIGTTQVTSINQNPIIASFDSANPSNNWVRTDIETTGTDSKGRGIAWDGNNLYGVFAVDGTQGSPSQDFRRASSDASTNWLRSYGSGGGRSVGVIGRFDPSTGELLDAAYLSAVLSSGQSNSLRIEDLEVNENGNLVVSAQSFFSPRRPNGQAMTRVSTDGTSPFDYTIELTPDLSEVVSTAAPGWV